MSKFLDDILYNTVKKDNHDFSTKEEVEEYLNKLYNICDTHWKASIAEHGSILNANSSEIVAAMDRAFNSWASFANKLTKENHSMSKLVSKYTYKHVFMANPDAKKAYDTVRAKSNVINRQDSYM